MNNYIIISKTDAALKNKLKIMLAKENISKENVLEIIPQENGLLAEQIRRIISISAHNFPIKTAFVIWGFDSAKEELQNMLLKTLEEHQSNLYFFLGAYSTANILPTIISRCQIITAYSAPIKPMGLQKQNLDKLINKAEKGPLLLSAELKTFSTLKKQQLELFLLDFITYGYYELLENIPVKKKVWLAKKLKHALQINRLIQKNYLDPELAADQLFI